MPPVIVSIIGLHENVVPILLFRVLLCIERRLWFHRGGFRGDL